MIGRFISHYRVIEKLGEGGMGVVYKAHDTRLDRFVALKFLPPELTSDENVRSRFIQEARAASSLDHPNIAVVHEIGELDDGTSFICMAYYEGETLRALIDSGPIPPGEAMRIVHQICDGLERAHDAGIIHRDIKPANLILTPDGTVKIVDFGLAKLSGQAPTSNSGKLAGTTAYMSPEQIQGGTVDQRSDLFSLGIVIYEMLTGRRPFAGDHEAALLYSIVHDEPPPPSLGQEELGPDVDALVLRLLAKDPAKRYQRAGDVRADIERLSEGMHIASYAPAGRHTLLRKKNLRVLSSVAVIALSGLAAALFFSTGKSFTYDPREAIVLAEFENATRDSVFDHSLTQAMRFSLRQSAHITFLSQDHVAEALRRMQRPDSLRFDEAAAVAVARREGAPVVIAGSIMSLGESYLLSCKIIEAMSGEPVRFIRRNVPSIEHVLPEMDNLCEDIRTNLGESLGEISRSAVPLEKVTTPSLDALELYSRGTLRESQGDYQGAVDLKEQAVALDSTFTVAISDLSYDHRKLGNDSLALFYHERVLPLIDKVTERERSFILSTYYGPSFELDFPKAVRYARLLVARNPNDAEAYATLGNLEMLLGDTAAAMDANRNSLRSDSIYARTVFHNAGFANALGGNAAEALSWFRKAKVLRPTYYAIDMNIARAYWMEEEYDSAARTLNAVIAVADPVTRVQARVELASLLYFQGKLRLAEAQCRSAAEECRQSKRPADEAYVRYLLGRIAAAGNRSNAVLPELKAGAELSASAYQELPLIGAEYAARKLPAETRAVIARIGSLRSLDPSFRRRREDYLNLVRGESLRADASYREAAETFKRVEEVYCGDPIYLLAQRGIALCAADLRDSSAAELFASILGHRGEVVFARMLALRGSGVWVSELWPEVHLQLARLYSTMNRPAEARTHLSIVQRIWANADEEYANAREAQTLRNRLGTEQ